MKKLFQSIASLGRIVWSTMILQMKQSFARPMFRFCLIINPIVNTIFLYELFLQRDMGQFINYVVLGSGLMGLWSCICFSSVGDINRERYSGTLPFLYTAPGGFGVIIFGKVMGNTVMSLGTFFLSYITARLLSGRTMEIQNMGYFIFSVIVTIICFVIVSIWFAYALMLSRKTELYMNLLEIPIVFLCGFTFPIEVLPKWVQGISSLLAPTWAVRMLKMSVGEVNTELFFQYLMNVSIELVIFVLLTLFLFRRMDFRIRTNATLEVS